MPNRSISKRRQPVAEPSHALWIAGFCLLLLTAAPYALGDALIELEVFVAQPLLRVIALLGAVACLGWAIRRHQYSAVAVYALPALFLCWELWGTLGRAPLSDEPAGRSRYLRVYSQNIGMESPEKFIGLLAVGNYDLVLLQEAYAGHRKGWEVLAEELGYHHTYQMLRRDAGMGAFFMSRVPLEPLTSLAVQSWGRTVRYIPGVQIEFRKKKIDVYSVHLESLPLVEGQRMIMGSSALRRRQAEALAEVVVASQQRVIVAGDFNSTPIYRSVAPLRAVLDDAWIEGGWGFGFTYHATVPIARIDAILQRGFDCRYAEVVKASDSDHRGVYAVFELEN